MRGEIKLGIQLYVKKWTWCGENSYGGKPVIPLLNKCNLCTRTIRNIGKEYVKAIDEKAKALNMSRNEFLNRYLIGYAHHREALGREDRLEKFLNETQQQMLAFTMLMDMMTDTLRELSGLDDDES